MQTAEPFHNFHLQNFLKRRFAPVIGCILDDDVVKFFERSHLSFFDFFAPIAINDEIPYRMVNLSYLNPKPSTSIFNQTMDDLILFGLNFLPEEFQKSGTINPEFCPIEGRLKNPLTYPSSQAFNPPWYRIMLERYSHSLLYSDFKFYDLPCCIAYFSLGKSKRPLQNIKRDILDMIPKWMVEFILTSEYVHVSIFDGQDPNPQPKEPLSDYKVEFSITLGSTNGPTDFDKIYFNNTFAYDQKLLEDPHLCDYLGEKDRLAVLEFLSNLRETVIQPYFSKLIKSLIDNQNYNNNLKVKLRTMIKGKYENQLKTNYQKIPITKIVRLQLASARLNCSLFYEAQLTLKEFIKKAKRFPALAAQAEFVNTLLSFISFLPSNLKTSLLTTASAKQFDNLDPQYFQSSKPISAQFPTPNYKPQLKLMYERFPQFTDQIFPLYIPIVFSEIFTAHNLSEDAISTMLIAIQQIQNQNKNEIYEYSFQAILQERLSGIIDGRRKQLYYLYKAGESYLKATLIPHALRCNIWLSTSFPPGEWPVLPQSAELMMIDIFEQINQTRRLFETCTHLFSIPNLSWQLHDKVVKAFWRPFRKAVYPQEAKDLVFPCLLKIKNIAIINRSDPQYWGLKKSEFNSIIEYCDEYYKFKKSRAALRTINDWYGEDDSDNENASKVVEYQLGINDPILIVLYVKNPYNFDIKLHKTVLAFHNEKKLKSSRSKERPTSRPRFSTTAVKVKPQIKLSRCSSSDRLQPDSEENVTKTEEINTKTEENTNKTEENTNKTEENTNRTEDNDTKTEENTTKTEENTTKTEENTTKTEENTTTSEENTTKTEENTTTSEENTNKTEENTTTSEENTTKTEEKTTTFAENIKDISKENEEQTNSNEDKNPKEKSDKKHKHHKDKHKKKTMWDEAASSSYQIETATDIVIPGKKKEMPTPISFWFHAKNPGRYLLRKFIKSFWGLIDNSSEISFGQIFLETIDNFTSAKIVIEDLPDTAFAAQCFKFHLKVINEGTLPLKNIGIAYDNITSIVGISRTEDNKETINLDDEHYTQSNRVGLLKIDKEIPSGQSETFEFLFTPNFPGEYWLHFVLYVDGIKCAYARKEIKLKMAINTSTEYIQETNVLCCNIMAFYQKIQILGIITKNRKFLPIFPGSTNTISPLGTISYIVLVNNESNSEKSQESPESQISPSENINNINNEKSLIVSDESMQKEEWRSWLLKDNEFALLFSIEGETITAQLNLNVKMEKTQLKTELIASNSVAHVGQIGHCQFRIINPTEEVYYVKPDPFSVEALVISGIQWKGYEIIKLCKENQYKCEFEYETTYVGIYSITGFSISNNLLFENAIHVDHFHSIQVQ